jgi:glycosyltransferase involved in cell wall biosynthesis
MCDMSIENPRVGMLFGGMPGDIDHLVAIGRELPLSVYHSTWVQPGGARASADAPVGVTTHPFRPAIRARRGHLAFYYPGLRRHLDRDRLDVLHVVSEPWGLLALQAAEWASANPNVRLVLHGCDTIWHHGSTLKKLARRAAVSFVLRRTDAYAAENAAALRLARQNGLAPLSPVARIHTNPRSATIFGVPTAADRSRHRRHLGLADGEYGVGIIGRLVPQKGIHTFLDAARELVEAGFPAKFFVAGDGALRGLVEQREGPAVRYLSTLAHPAGVASFLGGLDVLACPSLPLPNWEDQGPRVVLEAMMSGCIPVGSRSGGIPEMLGGHGLLTQPGDVRELAQAVRSAAGMSQEPKRRADVARFARDTYSAEAVARQHIDLWTTVAGTARAPRPKRESG